MKHDQYKELLHLSFYHELADDEQEVLDAHLASCVECGAEFEELRKLETLLGSERRFEVTDALLDEARRELRVALRLERAKRPFWNEWLERFDMLLSPRARVALGGVAMLVVGVSIGYLVFVPFGNEGGLGTFSTAGQLTSQRAETRVTNFRFIQQSPQIDQVEFTFDIVTPVHMKGNIHDNAVQRVMAQAMLDDQNPGARLRTVSAIADQVEGSKAPDKEIKGALIQAVKSDGNVGVRKEALKALQKFPLDNEIKDALLYVLRYDENPGRRIDAINYFQSPGLSRQFVDKDFLDVLKEKMQSDNNNYIRTRARHFYEEVQQQ